MAFRGDPAPHLGSRRLGPPDAALGASSRNPLPDGLEEVHSLDPLPPGPTSPYTVEGSCVRATGRRSGQRQSEGLGARGGHFSGAAPKRAGIEASAALPNGRAPSQDRAP